MSTQETNLHSNTGSPALFYFLKNFSARALMIVLLGFVFYANTLENQYALDDGIVIKHNAYVQEGLKGIPKILSTDAYDSYYTQMHAKQELSGGRYRPLSIVIFAIEHQFFGENTFVRHAVNVLFFLASLVIMLYFLEAFLFKELPFGTDLAFLTTLLFTIHPIHTEVIANVKSLDEILSLLFIMLTFICMLKYDELKQSKYLICSMAACFLAFLAKEYAITLIALVPGLFWVIKKYDLKKSILASWPVFLITAIYLLIRFAAVGLPHHVESKEILDNPYLLATGTQKWATEIFVMGKYLRLLIFPYPLACDYSYNQIPYQNFASPEVWLSIFLYLAMIFFTVKLFLKRHPLAFGLLFFFANLFLINNFFISIGATMGERLVYHSSLGFVMALAFGVLWIYQKMKQAPEKKRPIIFIPLALILLLCGYWTIARNAVWKNDITLFIHDVKVVPNSVMVNGNAGARLLDLSDKPENKGRVTALVNEAITHLNKAIKLHPTYVNAWLNLGVAYYKLQEPDQAKKCWDYAYSLYPDNPKFKTYYPLLANLYLQKALKLGQQKKFPEAIQMMRKAAAEDSTNATIWYNMGGAYFTVKQYNKAKQAWGKCLQLQPNNKDAQRGMAALKQMRVVH